MLERKIMDTLLSWKNKEKRKSLIVSGARQVGKTFIVRRFAEQNYVSHVEMNFLENPSLKSIFQYSLNSEELLTGISLNFRNFHLVPGNTLLFLDEIQECPNAITALKFLTEDERFDVIASGSALGMAYNRVTSFPVGYVEYADMYPLDFGEFLKASGVEEPVFALLENCFKSIQPVPEYIHEKMMQLLRKYMVLGGMPEVVDTFLQPNDYGRADEIQRRIYRDYLYDIARYAPPSEKIKAENCYKSIPLQLSKENHKFQYSVVEKRGTARKFESSIDWLVSAHIAFPVMNVSGIEYPLKSFALTDNIRLYPSDIGLLVGTYSYDLKNQLLQELSVESAPDNIILKSAKGGLYEALAADFLIKKGYDDLFFYRNEQGTIEMEFLIESPQGVVPIEIKAGRNRTRSLDSILKKDEIPYGYKFSSQNIGKSGKKITMPLYMLMYI